MPSLKPRILQSFPAVEAANPGWTAVSGPYCIHSTNKQQAKKDQANLDTNLSEQQKLCPHAKRVDQGNKVWIVRKTPMIVQTQCIHRTICSSDLGIRGGRAFVENKERVRL